MIQSYASQYIFINYLNETTSALSVDSYSHHTLSPHFKAQESPEPVYDLSDCGLKSVPAGVFSKCKVLRKEALLLQVNINIKKSPTIHTDRLINY